MFNVKDVFFNKNFPDVDRFVGKESDPTKRRLLWRRYLTFLKQTRRYKDIQQLEQLQRLQQLERLEQLQQLEQLQRLQQLQQLDIRCGSYDEVEYRDGDVVYCDPPYEMTAGYNGRECDFDYKAFYEWVATRPYQVWFSSYQNIGDQRFKMVWAKGKANLQGGGANQKRNYECIYIN